MVSIDPGARSIAAAAWQHGVLKDTYYYEMVTTYGLVDQLRMLIHEDEDLFVELPQVYRQRNQKGDPNDLIAVAVTVGALKGRWKSTTLVLPRTWKGNVPKKVTEERAKKALSAEELARTTGIPAGKMNHVWDAIGLGLWALGRSSCR